MRIATIGVGYVGLVTGAFLADLGNQSICLDIDEKKIENLKKGIMPIFEPGLKELVKKNFDAGRIIFTTDRKYAIENSEIIFICVNTPQKRNGDADLTSIFSVADDIAKYINEYKLIVTKSTVPVGTTAKIKRYLKEKSMNKIQFDVANNPEFLREGFAIYDCRVPDRIIVGVDGDKAKELLEKLYKPIARTGRPIRFYNLATSELIKYASNTALAMKISLMNQLSALCEHVGADIKSVSEGVGLDNRIGPRFLQAGAGYGGSCFPKDVQALAYTMEINGINSELVRAIDHVNAIQKKSIVPRLKKHLDDFEGKTIAIWGLAFKPLTDDMREAPSLTIIEQLQNQYANVKVYDPEAMHNAKQVLTNVEFCNDCYDAVKDADALILVTEWDEFRNPDFEKMKSLMKQHIVLDARNIFDPEDMIKNGFKYLAVGRGHFNQLQNNNNHNNNKNENIDSKNYPNNNIDLINNGGNNHKEKRTDNINLNKYEG